jgi:hypothetical protein
MYVLATPCVVLRFDMKHSNCVSPGKTTMRQRDSHISFKDPAWLGPIFTTLKSIPGPYAHVPLDSRAASKKQLVCGNCITLDFNLQYEDQVRQSMASDRNSMHTKYAFVPFDNPALRSVGANLGMLLLLMDPATSAQDIVDNVGREFIQLMQDGHAPMFQHIYYETAGGSLTGEHREFPRGKWGRGWGGVYRAACANFYRHCMAPR